MFKIINLIFIFLLLTVVSCKNSSLEGLAGTDAIATPTTTTPTTSATNTFTVNGTTYTISRVVNYYWSDERYIHFYTSGDAEDFQIYLKGAGATQIPFGAWSNFQQGGYAVGKISYLQLEVASPSSITDFLTDIGSVNGTFTFSGTDGLGNASSGDGSGGTITLSGSVTFTGGTASISYSGPYSYIAD